MAVSTRGEMLSRGAGVIGGDLTVDGSLKVDGGIEGVGGGATIKEVNTGTIAIDPGSIATITRGSKTFTLTGAAAGDMIHMQPPAGLDDDLIFVGAEVTSANTVTVYLYNPTGGAIDDGSSTWRYIWIDLT